MSNKNNLYKTVPWFNCDEWKYVLELLFSPNSNVANKKEALDILLNWKMKCPHLPSAIESTLGILEIEINYEKYYDENNDRVIRLLYSSILMRFINHTFDNSQFKGQTLLQAAQMQNIPQWIVNLRHEMAHGHELPSLNILKSAAFYVMNWLFQNYWIKQNNIIKNYQVITESSSNQEQENYFEDDLLSDLISNLNLLSILKQDKFQIKQLNDIGDEEMKNSIFHFINNRLIKSKVGTHWHIEIEFVINKILKELNHIIVLNESCPEMQSSISSILTHKESLFMISENDFELCKNKNDSLPAWFVSAFEPLLAILHKRGLISTLVKELFKIANNNTEESSRRNRASQWIREISIGLYKSKLFAPIAEKYTPEKKTKNENLLLLLIHHHPNQQSGLTLDLLTPVPEIFCTEQFIYENLSKYNSFVEIYAKEFLSLSRNILSNSTIDGVLDLVKIISSDNVISGDNQNVQTVIDLAKECNDEMVIDEIHSSHNKDDDNQNEILAHSKWKRSSLEFDWKNCPLGVLPWQLNATRNPSFPPVET